MATRKTTRRGAAKKAKAVAKTPARRSPAVKAKKKAVKAARTGSVKARPAPAKAAAPAKTRTPAAKPKTSPAKAAVPAAAKAKKAAPAKTRTPAAKPKKAVMRLVEKAEAQPPAPLAPEAAPSARRPVDRPAAAPRPAPRKDRSSPGAAGVRELDWHQLSDLSRTLAQEITRSFDPEVIVGLAKGGVFVGQEIASALRREFHAVRLERRSRDKGGTSPEASGHMPAAVDGRRVLIVDDVAGTGTSLEAAVEAAKGAGAVKVFTATLIGREGGYRPSFLGLETADLVVMPWDYEPSTGAVGSAGDEFGV